MTEATCATCPHWAPGYRDGDGIRWNPGDAETATHGECRRNAPVPAPSKPFMITARTDWCGQHPERQGAPT